MLFLTLSVVLAFGVGCAGAPSEEPEGEPMAESASPSVHPEIWPTIEPPLAEDPELEQAVNELLGRMSLEEKVGQTIQAELRHVKPEDVKTYHLGSILNGGGSHPNNDKNAEISDWIAQADAFYEASMDTSDGGQAIPIIWGTDAVHGHNNVIGATLFPHNVGLGATRNPELMKRIGQVTATEVRVTGLDWTFGPTVAVPRDDRWGRTYEGYSEDPEIVRDYAGKIVEGLQGDVGADDFLSTSRVISTAKHFLGDGGTVGGKDQGDNVSTEEELRDIHAAGYVTALAAGTQSVMASFNSWHGVKLHGYGELLTGVLKERMRFDGFVVGDWNGHGQVKGCTNSDCPEAFNAGVDMYMVPEDFAELYKNLLQQVRDGEIRQERLDDAVRRILRVKMRAGLFDRGKPSSREGAGQVELLGSAEHRALARQAVRESLVLLKNEGRLLPLSPKQKILVAGDGADNIGKQTGGWTITWQGTGNQNSDFPGATSIWGGISKAVKAAGGKATLAPKGRFKDRPDVAIVVFGENPYAEFQGDLKTIEYQAGNKRDLKLLQRLQEEGIPVVSVFLSGRPLWVNPELNASQAFVAAWLPGSEGGGIADVLFADENGEARYDFTGKLSYSWPKDVAQVVLNRHDADYDPLFPYGFGLTYADEGALASLGEEVPAEFQVGSDKVYFLGGPVDPWKLYLATGGEEVEVAGALTELAGSTSSPVDREVQEDARRVSFAGGAPASFLLRGPETIDLSRESNGDLALGFAIRADEEPTDKVELVMGCGESCEGALDVTERLRTLPPQEWVAVRVRLRCFEQAGTDMTRIDTPFAIRTSGAAVLSLAEIELVSAAEGETLPCP